MRRLCSIYILIAIFSVNEERAFVGCAARLSEEELVHLSRRLDGLECLKLLEAVYEVTPFDRRGIRDRDATANAGECLSNLERWNDDFPGNSIPDGRATMEMTLRWLGRPDLASYVRTNQLRFRRHALQTKQNKNNHNKPSNKKKKKKKKKKKNFNHMRKKKAQAKHRLKKKEDHTGGGGGSTICCTILVFLAFAALLAAAVYLYQRRNRSRRARFKYARSPPGGKEDKNTVTDRLPEETCRCSDVEGGCTPGKCDACDSERSRPHLGSKRRPRRVDRKSRGIGQMLRRRLQFGKREKDQENRDRKKILEFGWKRGKRYAPREQCACCRCVLDSRDKMLREKYGEKRALDRWRRRRKRTRRDKKWSLDEHANVCFESTCN